jgi:predicted thioesterase
VLDGRTPKYASRYLPRAPTSIATQVNGRRHSHARRPAQRVTYPSAQLTRF